MSDICEHCKHCIRELRTQRDYCTYYNIYTYAVNKYGKCDEFEAKFKPPTNPYKDYLNERFGKDAVAIEKMGNRIGEALGSIQNPYIKNFTVDASVVDNADEIREIRKCYCQRHVDDKLDAMLYGIFNTERKEYNKMFKMDKVKKVIFNPPATIVYWFDGTKTIVKAQKGDLFDKEKGFAMACAKKFLGNDGAYYNEFRKHGADESLNLKMDIKEDK